MFEIRLEDSHFILAVDSEDRFVVTGDVEDGYTVFDIEYNPLYHSHNFESCIVWCLNN